MRYRESPPSPRFADRIKCFWSLEQSAGAEDMPQPVLPDGCPEIVFNLSDRFRLFDDTGGFEMQPRTLVAGQISRRLLIGPSGKVGLFGVRFHPAGAFGLLGVPLSDFTDRTVNLSDIWGGEESILHERLSEAGSFPERIAIFEAFAGFRLSTAASISQELCYSIGSIQAGNSMVRRLAVALGWSERRLERRFRECVGVAPKMFIRIMRFQRLLTILETCDEIDLADASVACGYYDQSHMNRDFASFAGTSPTAFLKASHRLSAAFVTGN
jgi:AraC-like DNA-binding protein